MPSVNRNHGAGVWREAAQAGGIPTVASMFIIDDAGDAVFGVAGPNAFAWYALEPSGDFDLIDLNHPGYIVADGSDYTFDDVGPAVAVIVQDGSDFVISTDLAAPSPVMLRCDVAGTIYIIPRTMRPLQPTRIRGDIYL